MISFLKKLFTKQVEKPLKINLNDNIDANNSMGFDLLLGFDVNFTSSDEPTLNIKVNRLIFASNNELGKHYINFTDEMLLKTLASMLCVGASQHILSTSQTFSRASPLPAPPIDKSQLN